MSKRKFESNDILIHFVEFLNVQKDILILMYFVGFRMCTRGQDVDVCLFSLVSLHCLIC